MCGSDISSRNVEKQAFSRGRVLEAYRVRELEAILPRGIAWKALFLALC